MASSIEMLKVDLVDQLEHMTRVRLEPALGEIAAPFIRKLFADVPPSDLVPERPEELVVAALSLFEFLQERPRGSAKVRVYEAASAMRPEQRHTIIDIVNDDMPFLVDSVRGALERLGVELRLLLHPILEIERGAENQLRRLRVAELPAPGCAESVMQIWLTGVAPEDHPQLEARLLSVLEDVRVVVQDFAPMRDHCLAEANALRGGVPSSRRSGEVRGGASAEETSQFLDWLAEAHFIFQGYSYCRFERAPVSSRPMALTGRLSAAVETTSGARFDGASGLGILRDTARSMFDVFEPPRKRELLRVLKANRHSTVHRTVHLDTVLVSDFDEQGVQLGAHMFVGLFTASAYTSSASSIPVLQHKIAGVMARSGFSPGSYNYRRLHYILETYPRDELFQISDADLFSISLGIFHLQLRKRVALFARRDPFGRFMSCLVYLPRDRMETALRRRIEGILERELDGSLSAYYPSIGDAPLARLHYIIKTPNGIAERLDFFALERKIETTTRSWQDRLGITLPAELGSQRGLALLRRYADAFPANYREDFDEVVAVNDIECIEEALQKGKLTLQLYRADGAEPHELRFKVVSPQAFVAPSEILPILENLGLRVVAQVPYEIQLPERQDPLWLHDFSLLIEDRVAVDLGQSREDFYEVFSKTWDKRVDDDAFNKLVLSAGLSARQVALLRAYAKYLRQIQVPFSEGYMQQTLRRNAKIARGLIALFGACFDPDARDPVRAGQIEDQLARDLDAVQSLDEDRILRLFLGVIRATVRTNFWQTDSAGQLHDHLSFKLDSGRLPEVPKPAPFREIFVSGPRVEGVHLRFGEVARGGLRWSDRLEDFRTEVLGLCKAQQVKNAVIVPVGSKGGFVVKRPPAADAGRDAQRAEGIACYQIFVSSLLDLTDNRRQALGTGNGNGNGKRASLPPGGDVIVPPARTVCHDAADPYLVVAADKGTATFSDIANRLSQDRGFWLDDAFASGGSAGYDHKKMGITARGVWECVKRHFRELGKDIQREDFTCSGVGDMSGDVFGNGMLLSRHIKLVAAFDHRHIFLDPDPDPERSWQERNRLFQLDRSSWDDYDRSLISKGGGVFSRSLKRIPLSAEVQALLGENQSELDPSRLMQAILRARVELCFFGGIGSYVKAGTEADAQVGDRSNDSLRINGSELRAKVVGEGANLAMTQRGRIEYCRSGGRCNSDFIDNSAGVDCSDHEVNIKILLGDVERRAGMTREQRNELLREMTDDVAALVLRDNYLQSQTLSISTQLSQHLTDRVARTMRNLEKAGKLHRRLEALPDDDVLEDRQRVGTGFARPELCVLLAYAKNSLAESLLAAELPDDPLLLKDFYEYFPAPLRERFADYIRGHRLRREILVTVITNDLVNRVGIAFVNEVGEATGAGPTQVTLAYVAVREIVGARELWAQIEALDNLASAQIQGELLVEVSRLIERLTTWLLHEHAGVEPHALVSKYRPGVQELRADLGSLLTRGEHAALIERTRGWTEAGVPESLAERVGSLQYLLPSVDIVRVAELARVTVAEAGQLYFKVGRKFGFEWLRHATRALPKRRAWDRQAVAALRDELFASQREVTLAILTSTPADQDGAARLHAWGAARQAALARSEHLVAELRATETHDFAMLTVAARQLESLSKTITSPAALPSAAAAAPRLRSNERPV